MSIIRNFALQIGKGESQDMKGMETIKKMETSIELMGGREIV